MKILLPFFVALFAVSTSLAETPCSDAREKIESTLGAVHWKTYYLNDHLQNSSDEKSICYQIGETQGVIDDVYGYTSDNYYVKCAGLTSKERIEMSNIWVQVRLLHDFCVDDYTSPTPKPSEVVFSKTKIMSMVTKLLNDSKKYTGVRSK